MSKTFGVKRRSIVSANPKKQDLTAHEDTQLDLRDDMISTFDNKAKSPVRISTAKTQKRPNLSAFRTTMAQTTLASKTAVLSE